jgi:4-amino-4-deoxy-L-arabinose transferase-like glycosyltransferase
VAGRTLQIWAPTDGLMTDSGQGPLVGLPVAIGIALFGVGVEAMRAPVALLAAAAVPVCWLLGRRVIGAGPATLAAVLLATSPVFLLYGRTATIVGVSLLPLLLAALALACVLDAADERWHWRREGLLAGSLLLGIYAYAPVRLLWPLTVALLCLAARRDRERRRVLLATATLCLLVVPVALMVLDQLTAPEPDPAAATTHYFHARGEQLLAMSGDPTAAGQYVRGDRASEATGLDAVAELVAQNAADLGRLMLDRDTRPVPTDYWNESGRFWPWFLVPFAVVGATAGLRSWWRAGRTASLLPLVLGLGLTLPLLLTSRVHVGRLVPALPFALLLVAAGIWIVSGWLAALARRAGAAGVVPWVAPLLTAAVLVPAAIAAHVDLGTPFAPSREARTAALLAAWQSDVAERGGAFLVEDPALGDDIERVHAATYRLDLERHYRLVDLTRREPPRASDPRPALYWRGALGALEAGEISRPCQRLWFVTPEITAAFFAAWQGAGCGGAPDSVVLP